MEPRVTILWRPNPDPEGTKYTHWDYLKAESREVVLSSPARHELCFHFDDSFTVSPCKMTVATIDYKGEKKVEGLSMAITIKKGLLEKIQVFPSQDDRAVEVTLNDGQIVYLVRWS